MKKVTQLHKEIDYDFLIDKIRKANTGRKKLKIAYDIDDVLNNLNEYVFNCLGLTHNKPKRFNLNECKDQYTLDIIQSVYKLYGDPNTFRQLRLVPGAKDIYNVESTGKADVWINSSNYNNEISDIKRRMLLDEIPGIHKDRIVMQLGKGDKKEIIDTDVIIEDCLVNLFKYPDYVVKIIVDKSHNQASEYRIKDEEHGIIRVIDLIEANLIVNDLVSIW